MESDPASVYVKIPGKAPSKAWYLLPIFSGIIGGLIMFLVLKDEDRRMAKKGVVAGIVLTAIYSAVPFIVIGIVVLFAGA